MTRLFDERAAAQYLRVERGEIRRLLKLGALPPLRLGGVLLVREKDLKDYLAGRYR